jgi:Gamma tubulin complex component N-terminal
VQHLLLLYRRSVDNQVQGLGERLLAVVHSLQWVGPPLVAVSAFCTPPAGKRLKGLVALEQLNSMCSQLNSGRTACVFLALLRAAAEAYLRTLWAWLFEGRLPDDKKAAEFLIQAQPATLGRRDHAFWADSFLVLENRVPTFLKGLEHDIKQCGIALSFLKLYKINVILVYLHQKSKVINT